MKKIKNRLSLMAFGDDPHPAIVLPTLTKRYHESFDTTMVLSEHSIIYSINNLPKIIEKLFVDNPVVTSHVYREYRKTSNCCNTILNEIASTCGSFKIFTFVNGYYKRTHRWRSAKYLQLKKQYKKQRLLEEASSNYNQKPTALRSAGLVLLRETSKYEYYNNIGTIEYYSEYLAITFTSRQELLKYKLIYE